MADIGASVIARLKERAAKDGLQLQLLLNLFCQEEFLRRIQKTRYLNNLILKGGFLLYSISGYASRPTMDADYLMKNQPNDMVDVAKMVNEIIDVTNDPTFIKLEIVKLAIIAQHREYNGIRVNMVGVIKNTRTPFAVDFGVGDVVVPSPIKRRLEVLLSGFDHPEVLTYSFESIIAEKFDAIVSRMELTSRMKDFYDIYYLAITSNFEGARLTAAISDTFKTRNSVLDRDTMNRVAALANEKEMEALWNSFCTKTLKLQLDFREVVETIESLLRPICKSLLEQDEIIGVWNRTNRKWDS
ncbi:MAG: nucleotidyl transferase AbiEii/AbiGii toxin family protein [Bacillota bacterium]